MANPRYSFLFYSKTTPKTFLIRNQKFLREIVFDEKSEAIALIPSLRRLKLCKKLLRLETQITKDQQLGPLYKHLVKFLAKSLHFFKSYEFSLASLIYSPRRYNLNFYQKSSWYYFLQKSSVKFLKMYSTAHSTIPNIKEANKLHFKIRRHHKSLKEINDMVLEGQLLNPYCRKVISCFTQEWVKSGSLGGIEIKLWDHNEENDFFSSEEIPENRVYSIYLVNRCNHFSFIAKVLENSSNYSNLAKLEWWTKFSHKVNAKALHHLRSLEQLRELRIRFELEGDLSETSRKLLAHIKFPKRLHYLYFYIAGLRLKWIEKAGDYCTLEEIQEDRICSKFLNEIRGLEELETLWLAFVEIKMEYSLFFISILQQSLSIKTLLATMSGRNFDWKDSSKFSILELGFWFQNLPVLMKNLRSMWLEFPCIHLNKLPKQKYLFENLEVLSLSYRVHEKSKMIDLLEKLNPKTVRMIFFGDSIIENDEDFKKRFDRVATFEQLENISLALSMNKPISESQYNLVRTCILNLKALNRLSIRFERTSIEKEGWVEELTSMFRKNRKMGMALISAKNGIVNFSK